MTNVIKIRKGMNINLRGEAEKTVKEGSSDTFALKPTDFIGVFPKLILKPGDEVKAGTNVFYDKYRENIKFSSPVSGKIVEVRRGPKRVMLEIIIEPDGKEEYEDFGKADPAHLQKEEITEKLLNSGIWPVIRQRPYSVIANPKDDPKAIVISAFDTSPMAPDYDLIVHGQGKDFQTGLDALAKLTNGKVHLNVNDETTQSKVFLNSKNVQINRFAGPHPAGNIGVQMHHLDPINKGEVIWYVGPQEVLLIGRLFNEGKYDATKTFALAGSEVLKPSYFKLRQGANISNIIKDNVTDSNLRYISGNVLTGTRIERSGYIGFYDSLVSIIPEGDYFEFFGWAMPGLKKLSFYRSYFSWLTPNKKYRLDTNLKGGERAFVLTGNFEQVLPMDIYPLQLIKAIMIEDIDLMENLGIYEVDEEDFALCEFIDPSKTEIQKIVRKGLNLMRHEMS